MENVHLNTNLRGLITSDIPEHFKYLKNESDKLIDDAKRLIISGNDEKFFSDRKYVAIYILTCERIERSIEFFFSHQSFEQFIEMIYSILSETLLFISKDILSDNILLILKCAFRRNKDWFSKLVKLLFTELSLFHDLFSFFSEQKNKYPEFVKDIASINDLHMLVFFKIVHLLHGNRLRCINDIFYKNIKPDNLMHMIDFAKSFISLTGVNSVCKEFIRYMLLDFIPDILDKMFEMEQILKNPGEDVYLSFLPSRIAKDILNQIEAGGNIDISHYTNYLPRNLYRVFLCDCIRWCLTTQKLEKEKRVYFINYIMNRLSDRRILFSDHEFLICLCLDFISCRMPNKVEKESVSTLSSIFEKLSDHEITVIVSLLENFSKMYPCVQDNYSRAHTFIDKKLPFKNIQLKKIDRSASVDFSSSLDELNKKMKWRSSDKHQSMIEQFVKSHADFFQDFKFDVPPKFSDDLKHLIEDKMLLTEFSVRNPHLFVLYLYKNFNVDDFNSMSVTLLSKNPRALQTALEILFQLYPELTVHCSGILLSMSKIKDISLKNIIKIVSHICTLDEIQVLFDTPFFVQNHKEAEELFQDSISWNHFAQSTFWTIIDIIYSDCSLRGLILDGIFSIAARVSQPEHIARESINRLLSTARPGKESFDFLVRLSENVTYLRDIRSAFLSWFVYYTEVTLQLLASDNKYPYVIRKSLSNQDLSVMEKSKDKKSDYHKLLELLSVHN